MSFLLWLLLGSTMGILAYLLEDERSRESLKRCLIFGIAGALSGGIVGNLFFGGWFDSIDINSIVTSMLISVLVLFMIKSSVENKLR